jgi:hypothetical protein
MTCFPKSLAQTWKAKASASCLSFAAAILTGTAAMLSIQPTAEAGSGLLPPTPTTQEAKLVVNWTLPAAGRYQADLSRAAIAQSGTEEIIWLGSQVGQARASELATSGWECRPRGQWTSCRIWAQLPWTTELRTSLQERVFDEAELELIAEPGNPEQITFGDAVQEWRLPFRASLSSLGSSASVDQLLTSLSSLRVPFISLSMRTTSTLELQPMAPSQSYSTVRLYDYGTSQRIDLGARGEGGPGFALVKTQAGQDRLSRLFSIRLETSRWTSDIYSIEVPFDLTL